MSTEKAKVIPKLDDIEGRPESHAICMFGHTRVPPPKKSYTYFTVAISSLTATGVPVGHPPRRDNACTNSTGTPPPTRVNRHDRVDG